jgi:hypothetical protein
MRRALAMSLLALGACAGGAQTVSLRLTGDVSDALVTVDDQHLGTLGYVKRRGVALPPGTHRITVEKAGYFPFDKLVEARPGDGPVTVDVRLEPIPD